MNQEHEQIFDPGAAAVAADSVWDGVSVSLRSAIRTAPLWVLAGLVGYLGASMLQSSRVAEPTATVEIGLTDQVVWPFYDVVLSEAVGRAADAETIAQASVPNSLLEYQVQAPEGKGVVRVVITAQSIGEAEAAATAVGAAVVDGDLAELTARLQQRIDIYDATASAATADLDSVMAEIDATAALFVPNLPESTRRQLDLDLQVLQAERDAAIGRQTAARAGAQEATIELETAGSQVEVSNITLRDNVGDGPSSVPLAVAIGAALAAAIVLNVYQREFGRIVAANQIREVIGLPTIPFPKSPVETVPLARLLAGLHRESNVQRVGIASLPAGFDSPHLMALALKEVGENVQVSDFDLGSGTETLDSPILTVLDPLNEATLDAQLHCDVAFIVTKKGATLRALRQKVGLLEDLGLPVRGILFRQDV